MTNVCDEHLYCHQCSWVYDLPLPEGGLVVTGSSNTTQYLEVTV